MCIFLETTNYKDYHKKEKNKKGKSTSFSIFNDILKKQSLLDHGKGKKGIFL